MLLTYTEAISSHFTTDGQSVRPSWRRAPFGTHDQILICYHGTSSLTRGQVCPLLVVLSLSDVTPQKIKLFIICTICRTYNAYNIFKSPCQSRSCRADCAISCPTLFYNDSLVTWTS